MQCKLVARSISSYVAQSDEELSFEEGDILFITDDTDPGWWMAKEKPVDTFQEARVGLVPVTYLEEAEPLSVVTASYAYDANTTEEISFPEGALIRVYEMNDSDWWFAKYDHEVGLVPASYLEAGEEVQQHGIHHDQPPEIHIQPVNHVVYPSKPEAAALDEDAASQKDKLLSALGGLGFQKPRSSETKAPREDLGPDDIKYYSVTEVDKKKKKNNRKGYIGISDDFSLYFISDLQSKDILSKWPLSEITKYSEKKSKRVTLEFGADSRDFEGEKADIGDFYTSLEQMITKSKMSGPISKHPLPIFGGPTAGPPPPAPVPAPAPALPPVAAPAPPPAPVFAVPTPAVIPPPPPGPSPASAQKLATVLYDYDATNEEELTIREGESVIVLDDSDDAWWHVRQVSKKGGAGIVPAS
ncbi:hypothetical protein BDK51DRAFT_26735, partial [Blyttiomyces helicus]